MKRPRSAYCRTGAWECLSERDYKVGGAGMECNDVI